MPEEPFVAVHPEHVVLDVGDGAGALVLYTEPGLLGEEIEISPTGDDHRRTHQHVLERPTPGQTHHAAVFDHLSAGTYTLWRAGSPYARNVAIASGHVTELHWRPRLR
ncbi:MAG: phospholipase [Actinobacteria bacterium]|nr:phospholipase [Actinomycetota bacterium]